MRQIALAVVLLSASLAHADELPDTPPPAPVDEAQPPPAPPPAPPSAAPPSTVPPIASDSPAVEARFQAAIDALIAQRFAEAADLFAAVAAESVDLARQNTAREMSEQARARATAAPAGPGDDQSREVTSREGNGRYGLLASTGVLGLALYGPTLTVLADSDSAKTSIGLYMLGAGGSFFGSYLLTRDEPITWAMTDAWIHGATRGAWHGYSLLTLSRGDWDDPDSSSGRAELGSMSLGSVAEGTAFALFAREAHASAGLTNAMGKASDFGLLLGLGLSATLVADEDLTPRTIVGSGLLGAGLGYLGGYAYAQHRDLTWGDGEAMRASVMVGLSVASVPLVLADANNQRAIAGTLVAGGAAALLVGDKLLEDHDFSAGQGVVMEVSTLAGGLVGAGLGYLISPDDNRQMENFVVTTAALGTIAGFAIPFFGFDTRPRATSKSAPASVQIVPTVSSEQRGVAVLGSF